MSRTTGNPPVPVASSASIVCAYNDHAVHRGSARAYGRHTPGAEYLPFGNVEGRNRFARRRAEPRSLPGRRSSD